MYYSRWVVFKTADMRGPVSPRELGEPRWMAKLVMHQVYVLKSEIADKYYIGQTNDLVRRLVEHNNGKSTYTRRHMPWYIVYSESVPDRQTAVKREKYLKSAAGRKWLKNNARVAKLVDALP